MLAAKTKQFSYAWNWLEKQPLVVVGYFDDCKGINFIHLIAMYLDCGQSMSELAEYHPYLADYFQIRVISGREEDPRTLNDVLPEFIGQYHLQVYCFGEEKEIEVKNAI